MSFFIREDQGKLVFGGMKSIQLNYEHVTTFGRCAIDGGNGALYDVDDLWIIGSSVKTNYVKGRLSGQTLWYEEVLAKLAGTNDVIILVRLNNCYLIYRNSARARMPIEKGKYEWYYGCTESQVNDALNGILPTRWLIEHHQVVN